MRKADIDPVPVGKIPSGLFIVTTVFQGKRDGFLGSWIQQASFTPLLISMAMKPGRSCHEAIKARGAFCINIIGHKNNGLMKPFWSVQADQNPFQTLAIKESERGNLILLDAMAALECEFRSSSMPGDHEIIFAEVFETHILNAEDKPLTHIRKTGLSY